MQSAAVIKIIIILILVVFVDQCKFEVVKVLFLYAFNIFFYITIYIYEKQYECEQRKHDYTKLKNSVRVGSTL